MSENYFILNTVVKSLILSRYFLETVFRKRPDDKIFFYAVNYASNAI